MGALFGSRRADRSGDEARASYFVPSVASYASAPAEVAASPTAARQSVAVRTAADLIVSLVSELPAHVYRAGSTKQLPLPGNLQDPGATGYGFEDWVATVLDSYLMRGNVYGAEVAWDPLGRPRQVEVFNPDDVDCLVVDGVVEWWVAGKPFDRPNLFVHERVNPVAGRVRGVSPIEQHALQVGQSLAVARFGAQWFTDGAIPSILLVNSESQIDAEQARVVKERWMSIFRGTREPAVMGQGWDAKPLQVNPEESQFLETAGWTEAQCARIFGPAVAETLGYPVGSTMTYANVVDRRADLLALTLGKWIRRIERLVNPLLPDSQYLRFDRDALLETATLSRYQAHATALQNNWKTINEVRDDEDMPPVAWGDEPTGGNGGAATGA